MSRTEYKLLIQEIKEENISTTPRWWRSTCGYDPWHNKVHVTSEVQKGCELAMKGYKAQRFGEGALSGNPLFDCTQVGELYNEVWHAWWDTRLESDDDCKWLYDVFRQYAAVEYGGNLKAIDEAASETIATIVATECAGGTATYPESARSPDHGGVDEFKNPVSENLYKWILYALKNGCKRPPPQAHHIQPSKR